MIRCVVAAIAVLLAGCDAPEPEAAGGPPALRRLTEVQYRQVIADVFGDDIIVGGRFDPVNRSGGLLAVGAGGTAINDAALERFEAQARAIAAQAVDAEHRDVLVPCRPKGAVDDDCARTFFTAVGRLLFRRALTGSELAAQVGLAAAASGRLGEFYGGLAAALSAMLVRPEFLFIADSVEPDPGHAGAFRLTAHAKAARLSFLLWNTTPDDALLKAAETGALHDGDQFEAEVDRLLASPRFAGGVRAFFDDMLGFEAFDLLQKDAVIYPAFGLAAVEQSREQILRTIVDHVVARRGDYRELFTTRRTVMTADLGMVYRVPVAQPLGWVAHEFPPDGPRHGIQSLAGFVALFSHPGRSSATLRGKAIREILMCQKVPDPPPNVDFTLVSDSHNPVYKTARQRLDAHSTDPTCAGCHRIMDPIGLAFETFDGAGQTRSHENGVAIDTGGVLDGVAYRDAAGLAAALAANPAVPACLVGRTLAYGLGRDLGAADRPTLTFLENRFAASGYRVPDLLRSIALSKAFSAVAVGEVAP